MAQRMWLSLALLLVPTAVHQAYAQAPGAERLLPAGTQIYLHWDGFDAHRAAFDKTALGKMMQEDTGKFLSALWKYGRELFDEAVGQKEPMVAEYINEVVAVLGAIGKNGFVLGVELGSVNPPEAQGVFVFPGSGGPKGKLLPLLGTLARRAGADLVEVKVGQRVLQHINAGPVHVAFWNEPDNDAVLLIGTQPPGDYLKSLEDKKSFADSPLHKKLAGFKEFTPWARGHVDIPSILKKVGDLAPVADQLLGELGLKGLGGVSFYSGFDGGTERAIVDIDLPGPRKGLLALINQKTFTLKDLPPLPSDVTSFHASNFNLKSLYDAGITVAESAIKVYAPGEGVDVREIVRQFEAIIGVKFGDDLFGSFGDMFVSYSAASEGPLGLGRVYVFKVNHEKKLRDVLESLFRNIPPIPGAEIGFRKKDYRGGEIMQVTFKNEQGEYPLISMTIHKGWFALSSYPQPLYGFVLRAKGDLPSWKADENLNKALAAFPKEFVSIGVSDPRPALQFLLSVTPTALTLANSFLPQVLPGAKTFDITVVPHPQDATRHLFPNITVTTDDGKRIRSETRASLALPLPF